MIGGRRLVPSCLAAALLVATLAPGPVAAHRLNLFAAWDGAGIAGEAYFSGGAKAANIELRALGSGGKVVASIRTGKDGEFALPGLAPADIELVADAGDGHVARFPIGAAEMGGATGADGSAADSKEGGSAAARHAEGRAFARRAADSKEGGSTAAAPSAPEGLEPLIERAVARRIAPLQRQIAQYEAKVRLHDVLGAIGYLFGIAGLALWWLARREARGR